MQEQTLSGYEKYGKTPHWRVRIISSCPDDNNSDVGGDGVTHPSSSIATLEKGTFKMCGAGRGSLIAPGGSTQHLETLAAPMGQNVCRGYLMRLLRERTF
jgi:hypothetical protein